MDAFKDGQIVLYKVKIALNVALVDRFVLANDPKLGLYDIMVFIVLFTYAMNFQSVYMPPYFKENL